LDALPNLVEIVGSGAHVTVVNAADNYTSSSSTPPTDGTVWSDATFCFGTCPSVTSTITIRDATLDFALEASTGNNNILAGSREGA